MPLPAGLGLVQRGRVHQEPLGTHPLGLRPALRLVIDPSFKGADQHPEPDQHVHGHPVQQSPVVLFHDPPVDAVLHRNGDLLVEGGALELGVGLLFVQEP